MEESISCNNEHKILSNDENLDSKNSTSPILVTFNSNIPSYNIAKLVADYKNNWIKIG